MNQQSSEKRVSGRQGSNKGAQRTEAPMKSISDCSPERTGADREKRRAAADPSDPEAAALSDGKKIGNPTFNEFLLSMPKDDREFDRIQLKMKEIEW
ncbi:hypothetical protein [uncultured Sutterella sp.]|uniref:hypothetical protein n=1 Tax=uncultured Sutterella sp. TaxID=286133 RepID=UPI00259BE41E|nr:hypothetical protein [uncultured Sutterella sp.]